MALGAFAAIGQRNIKRLMAYSSIGHMGFALVGLAAGTAEGVQGVLVYMAIYVAMTLGTFACILAMRRDGQLVEEIGDLAGLAQTKAGDGLLSGDAVVLARGVPPLAGLFAKFYVFLAAIRLAYSPRRDRCDREASWRLLLSAHRQDHVFRRAGARVRGHAASAPVVLAVTGLFNLLFFVYPGCSSKRPPWRQSRCSR